MGFNGYKIWKNKEILELEQAIVSYHDVAVQQEEDVNKKLDLIDRCSFFNEQLFPILYDNLTPQEKQFINLLKDYTILQEDYLNTEDDKKIIQWAIQWAAEDLVENALYATLIMPKSFFYDSKIVNIFKKQDLVAYTDFFQQSQYTNEYNKLDEEAVIEHREDDNQHHPIVDVIESMYHMSELKKALFKKQIKQNIWYIYPYFKNTPWMFAYAFARSEMLNKHELHKIMRVYFKEHYLYIQENGFIDDRF
jgi:hypothetical protein